MQLEHRHHVERLGVLVRLRAVKLLAAVNHHLTRAGHEPLQLAHIRNRLDERASHRVLVARDRANDAAARILGPLHLRQQQLHQQKVPQVVDAERHLVTVIREAWLRVGGEVDCLGTRETTAGGHAKLTGPKATTASGPNAHRVAHEPVEPAAAGQRLLEVGGKVLDRLKRGELQLDRRIVLGRNAALFRRLVHLLRVAHRRDDVIVLSGHRRRASRWVRCKAERCGRLLLNEANWCTSLFFLRSASKQYRPRPELDPVMTTSFLLPISFIARFSATAFTGLRPS